MVGEKLRLSKKGDASGTKLPSDAGTNQHSNPSAEGRARWSNTKNVSNRRLNVGYCLFSLRDYVKMKLEYKRCFYV